jgi:hypothetical protein
MSTKVPPPIATSLGVAQIAQCAREGSTASMNRFRAHNVRKGLQWQPAAPVAGGVFDEFHEQPAWEAMLTYTPPNQQGGADLTIRIYDREQQRIVTFDGASSLAFRVLPRDLANGIIQSLCSLDPQARSL